MALIEYIEPMSIGSLFTGLASLIVALTMAYIFYRFYIKICQMLDIWINKEAKYEILEETYLDKIGKDKGINLEKELIRRNMFRQEKKTFRKRLEEQIYKEMFGEKEE